jgi:hypothetical protein
MLATDAFCAFHVCADVCVRCVCVCVSLGGIGRGGERVVYVCVMFVCPRLRFVICTLNNDLLSMRYCFSGITFLCLCLCVCLAYSLVSSFPVLHRTSARSHNIGYFPGVCSAISRLFFGSRAHASAVRRGSRVVICLFVYLFICLFIFSSKTNVPRNLATLSILDSVCFWCVCVYVCVCVCVCLCLCLGFRVPGRNF